MNRYIIRGLLVVGLLFATCASSLSAVSADITCYDFSSKEEVQVVLDALPSDPFGVDSGWPPPGVVGGGDQEAGNGLACDAENDIPEKDSPGNEEYVVDQDSALNGLDELPDMDLEKATVRSVQYAGAIQTNENPDPIYVTIGVSTPEFEIYSDYEEHPVPGQCGSAAATGRLKELLAPGTTIWLEVDETGFYTATKLDRQIWIELGGRYRLLAEVLISEGHGVTTTSRPGTGRGDAVENPPVSQRYRDALRSAQGIAIENRVGIWSACA